MFKRLLVKVVKRTVGNSYTLKRLEAAVQYVEMLPAFISNHFAAINQRMSELTERQQQTQTAQAAEWRQRREQLEAQAAALKAELERKTQEHAQALKTELQQQAQALRWLIEQVAQAPPPATPQTPLVSVIMTTWNRADVIARALQSVAAQTYTNWECIIVDDGSTDATDAELARWRADGRFRYVHQAHRGVGAARNTGLALARGETIAYLDTDNVWLPGYLQHVVAALAADDELDCVYATQLIEEEATGAYYVRSREFDHAALCQGNYIDLNVFAHRRRVYERVGGCDEALDRLNDWDLIIRYTALGRTRRLPALGGVYYDGRPDQISHTRGMQRNLYLIKQKQPRPSRAPLKVLYALWHYPQLSESYVRTEIRAARALGVEVEVWSEEKASVPFESEVAVHRGSLADAIARCQPDLVHTHWIHMAERYGELLRAHKLPLTVRAHGFDFSPETVARLDAAPLVQGIFAFPHHAAHYATHSAKVQALNVAFDPELYYPAEAKDHRLVLRTGCALPTKDYASFFRTAQLCPDHHFLLVLCQAFLKEEFLDEVVSWNKSLGEPVEIRANLQHEDVAALSRQAGIYLHTTNPAAPFGMPVSISEAMATGAYLLGRRLPAAAAYIGDAGALYETPEEAAHLIRQTTQWNERHWQQARTRSIDRAYGCFAHTEVLAPLVEHWRRLVAE